MRIPRVFPFTPFPHITTSHTIAKIPTAEATSAITNTSTVIDPLHQQQLQRVPAHHQHVQSPRSLSPAALQHRVAVSVVEQRRHHTTHRPFNIEPPAWRKLHTYNQLSPNSSTRFGGRLKRFRQARQTAPVHPGRAYPLQPWKRQPHMIQYNVDVWWAQETLRREWKGREFDVYEVPYQQLAMMTSSEGQQQRQQHPLLRVVPHPYTEPVFLTADSTTSTTATDHNNSNDNNKSSSLRRDEGEVDTRNSNYRTYPIESLQEVLFDGDSPFPPPLDRRWQHSTNTNNNNNTNISSSSLTTDRAVVLSIDSFFTGNTFGAKERMTIGGKYGSSVAE